MRKRKATRSEIIERNRKIVKDYEDGLSFEQLSEKYGLCVRTCYRALDEEQQAQRIAEEQDHANLVDKIVAEYQKNTRVRDIAEKYGVSIGYCSAIAVQAGISNKELVASNSQFCITRGSHLRQQSQNRSYLSEMRIRKERRMASLYRRCLSNRRRMPGVFRKSPCRRRQ